MSDPYKIREPWASGFGYGGLAKKIYCREVQRVRKKLMTQMSDPISRVIELVVDESMKLPLVDRPVAFRMLYKTCAEEIEAEFRQWATANEAIEKLEAGEKREERRSDR